MTSVSSSSRGATGRFSTSNSDLDSKECGYYDVRAVQRIMQEFLQTLAAASVEKAASDPFNQPSAFVEELKQEFSEYMQQRVEAIGASAKNVNGSGPVAAIIEAMQGFLKSKRSLIRRMSSRILSGDINDGRIEKFAHELDRSGAWLAGKRESFAKTLLKRVDKSKMFHCHMRFESSQELVEHKAKCSLRPVMCPNEGCAEVLSAVHLQEHDAVCPLKMLPCIQGCGSKIFRKDMEAHCNSVCSNKVVRCPFKYVGCSAELPQGSLDNHLNQFLSIHLLSLLKHLQKHETIFTDQGQRIHLIEKTLSIAQRFEAVDMNTVSLTLKEQDAKIKSLEKEVSKLQKDQKATDVSVEVLQLRRELRNLQKKVDNLNSNA